MPRITSLGQLPTPRLTPVPGVNHIPVYITRGTSDTLHMLPDILLIINKSGLHVASYASARCDLRDFAAVAVGQTQPITTQGPQQIILIQIGRKKTGRN